MVIGSAGATQIITKLSQMTALPRLSHGNFVLVRYDSHRHVASR